MIRATLLVLLAAGACVLNAGAADDLFAKTHKGAKESSVASKWYGALPDWVAGLTKKNQFPQTLLPFNIENEKLVVLRTGVNKFEIRDVKAGGKEFSAYLLAQTGTDGTGRPTYTVTNESVWVPFRSWPARYILSTYPVESNTDSADLVAFAAWLYGEKENELANRVLTIAHGRDKELAPLIEAYICEKEKWTRPADGMKVWNMWDSEFQKERGILVSAEEHDKRLKARETAAEKDFKALVAARGDYKGRPPRSRPPTMQLVLLEWEIKQYKITYASADFVKDTKNTDKLQEILDSITDDLAAIKVNMDSAGKMATDGNANDLKKKAEFMEEVLKIDPMDLNLRGQVAEAWYVWANPADHGNSCDRADGCKKAIPHYEVILQAYPRNTAFLMRMGKCYQALQDSKHARPYYQLVIDIEGTSGNNARIAKKLIENMDTADQYRKK